MKLYFLAIAVLSMMMMLSFEKHVNLDDEGMIYVIILILLQYAKYYSRARDIHPDTEKI